MIFNRLDMLFEFFQNFSRVRALNQHEPQIAIFLANPQAFTKQQQNIHKPRFLDHFFPGHDECWLAQKGNGKEREQHAFHIELVVGEVDNTTVGKHGIKRWLAGIQLVIKLFRQCIK